MTDLAVLHTCYLDMVCCSMLWTSLCGCVAHTWHVLSCRAVTAKHI